MNSKEFDNLIHSRHKETVLDSDVILSDLEELKYLNGIKLDVNNITIDWNGHTIDARGKARIFLISANNVTIKNITLKNAFSNRTGAAIYNIGWI